MAISISASGISTYNRLSGMESGLDTEALVKGLTTTEQNKVISAAREKQLLTWKRDAYREVINKLNSFNSNYFASGSIALKNMFSQYKATNTGSQYVSVKPGASSMGNSVVISDIEALATSSKLVSSSTVSRSSSISVNLSEAGNLSGKQMKVTLDGITKTITFSENTYSSVESVSQELQNQLNAAFGANRISISTMEDGITLTLSSPGNSIVLGKSDNAENDASTILGFNDGQSNMINLSDTLANLALKESPGNSVQFKINGKEFNFGSNTTLRDIISSVNSSDAGVTMSYSSITDKFTLTSKNTGTGNQIILEDETGTFLNSAFGSGEFTDGTNAVIKINTNAGSSDPSTLTYTTVVKSSNTFEIDGVTYSLLGKAEGTQQENIKINVEYDTDGVVNTIKQFVTDYNELLKLVTDKLSETKYKDYPPLTDDQRKELGTDDAAKYDEKAKSGLLANDSYLLSISSSLRNAMNADVKQLSDNNLSIGISLSSIGITTGLYTEKGQLKVNDDKLKKALGENPDKIIRLFTQTSSVPYSPYTTDQALLKQRSNESGMLNRISDIIQNNVKTTTGALVLLVGNSDTDYTSSYALKLRNIDDRIVSLQDKLKKQQDYYWSKFTKMESALSQLNKQTAYLSSFTSQG